MRATARARATALALTIVSLAWDGGSRPAAAQEASSFTSVTMGDGSSTVLKSWSLSYDLLVWPKGQPPTNGATLNRPGTALVLGKKSYPLAGSKLEIVYSGSQNALRELALTGADGKRTVLKLEAPQRELVHPDLDKSSIAMARSLDLLGETLTGTRRSFCLISFSTLVQCSDSPESRVVQVEFGTNP